MSNVSRETNFSTRVSMQIEAKRKGWRKLVRHGGTLCSKCLAAPPRHTKGRGGYCAACHAAYMADYRAALSQSPRLKERA